MSGHKQKQNNGNNLSLNSILQAIKDILLNKKAVYPTALAYNIPKTNLYRYVEKISKVYADISTVSDEKLIECIGLITSKSVDRTVFSDEEEEALVNYIVKCCKHYYGLSITELRQLAFQYAVKIGIEIPQNWQRDEMAGWKWYCKFMERHTNLSLRTPEQTSPRSISELALEAPSTSRAAVLSSVLQGIGPVKPSQPRKKSNRGPKPMKSSILTSVENITLLKEKQQKKISLKEKETIKKPKPKRDSKQKGEEQQKKVASKEEKAIKKPKAKQAKKQKGEEQQHRVAVKEEKAMEK